MFLTALRSLFWLTAALAGVAAALAVGADRGSAPAATAAPVAPPRAAAEKDNPRVEPGLVGWHASFADARAAAQKSGRPVLLFHMMGQLDRQFC
jgi:hypothetical protein